MLVESGAEMKYSENREDVRVSLFWIDFRYISSVDGQTVDCGVDRRTVDYCVTNG